MDPGLREYAAPAACREELARVSSLRVATIQRPMFDLRHDMLCAHTCDRCGTDLSAVATFARFCPHCGVKLADFAAARAHAGPLERAANLVLRGYANAMFRLGEHYEVRHNGDEAIRCYGKASQLGNEVAKSRLVDIPLARAMESTEDEANRPGTSVA
jgi:hypothetical protein